MARFISALLIISLALSGQAGAAAEGVRIKELCRIGTARDNSLVGYGLVSGLAGTGDSVRSGATIQSVSNTLLRFGVHVEPTDIRSRNVAAVMVTATLPPYAREGDKLDINITSLGDARSLLGGTLLLTHLTGPDGEIYALAQGPVSVGGFSYDLNGNVVQKNHPTAAYVTDGATVEKGLGITLIDDAGRVEFVLVEPDFTTASRVADSLNGAFGNGTAIALDARRVRVGVPAAARANLVKFLTVAENLTIEPDFRAKVVVNERTGTVVSGGDVRLSAVSVAHGDLRVSIQTEFEVSQPPFVIDGSDEVRTQVVPQTTIEVTEASPMAVSLPDGATVTDLVSALNRVKATSRDVITVLQAIKRAGALHAELVIQ